MPRKKPEAYWLFCKDFSISTGIVIDSYGFLFLHGSPCAHPLTPPISTYILWFSYFSQEHKVLLTGTPLQNTVEELFSLLHFLEPAQFPSEIEFLREFGDLKTEEQVGNATQPNSFELISYKPHQYVLLCILCSWAFSTFLYIGPEAAIHLKTDDVTKAQRGRWEELGT